MTSCRSLRWAIRLLSFVTRSSLLASLIFFKLHRNSWNTLLRGYVQHCARASMMGAVERHKQTQEAVTGGTLLECTDCRKQFDHPSALASHRAKKHGYANPFRRHIASFVCPFCLHTFHTPERIQHHMVRSRCGPKVLQLDPLQAEDVDAYWLNDRTSTKDARAGRPKRFARCPPERVPGPLRREH